MDQGKKNLMDQGKKSQGVKDKRIVLNGYVLVLGVYCWVDRL